MIREFNDKPLELLAPAGTFDIYKSVIDSSCDAVYLGGQILNMRLIRKGYNLSNEELKEAIYLANERDKKLYITVNSLLDESELNQANDYLEYLDEIKPHGLIVQDPAILSIINKKKLDIPVHSSVMMNVHNLEMIKFLKKQGVSRVVLSREMELKDVKSLSLQTDMELEYFTHGDMCVAHGAQCLYSSFVFGMSSNRGRCLKPCRWSYKTDLNNNDKKFPLAVKDLSLYSHVGDMILSGITSFKIEGRMREKDFVVDLINKYGKAIDNFLDDPLSGKKANMEDMETFKKRDYSTAYAFGKPGISNINSLGEGTGKFYSTGKVFSTPTKEKEIEIKEVELHKSNIKYDLNLFVKVNSIEQALEAINFNIKRIYLSTEPFAPDTPITLKELGILSKVCSKKSIELYLSLPKMTNDLQNNLFNLYLKKELPIDGILIGHFGMLELIDTDKYKVICDSSMNIYNSESIKFYIKNRANGWTPSLELPFDSILQQMSTLDNKHKIKGEVILHGLPTVMYMDHDVSQENRDEVELKTETSTLNIKRDCWDRYHILPEKELSLIPRLNKLVNCGYRNFRLELQGYNIDQLKNVISVCSRCLEDPNNSVNYYKSLSPIKGGFTYGAQGF